MKKWIAMMAAVLLAASALAGCGVFADKAHNRQHDRRKEDNAKDQGKRFLGGRGKLNLAHGKTSCSDQMVISSIP